MSKPMSYVLPPVVSRALKTSRDRVALALTKVRPCDAGRLGRIADVSRDAVLASQNSQAEWTALAEKMASLGIGADSGGVNPGDRRAVYCLCRYLRARRVLEIGTHVGASTTALAIAMVNAHAGGDSASLRLDTVDVRDVNDAASQPWRRFGSRYSPRELVKRLGAEGIVQFHVADSIRFMSETDSTFDFIFLDGKHTADRVYAEVCLATNLVQTGGFILLHDYFPALKPLWKEHRSFAAGPVLGVERLVREGAALHVQPLGTLPWTTKTGSRVTSLALLGRR